MSETAARVGLIEHFSECEDPRRELGKDHLLIDIIVIGILAVICGADDFVGMAEFGADQQTWLRTFLAFPKGVPSHDTFGRVFETRRSVSIAAVDWLPEKQQWRDLQSVGMVVPTREINGKVTKAVRSCLSSLAVCALTLAQAVGGHWSVENSCHWVLTWSFEKKTFASGQGTRRKIWAWCGDWQIACYNKKRRPR